MNHSKVTTLWTIDSSFFFIFCGQTSFHMNLHVQQLSDSQGWSSVPILHLFHYSDFKTCLCVSYLWIKWTSLITSHLGLLTASNGLHLFVFYQEHLFVFKTFSKLTKCMSCKTILWGVYNQVGDAQQAGLPLDSNS